MKFKRITGESYLQPDLPAQVMYTRDSEEIRPTRAEDFLRVIDSIQLKPEVSDNTADLLEVAKSAWAYGYLYHPLFTVALHYAVLALEAALYIRYRAEGGDRPTAMMGDTILFLEKKGRIPPDYLELLSWARKLRNELSHPKFAIITGPGGSILGRCADLINLLFDAASTSSD